MSLLDMHGPLLHDNARYSNKLRSAASHPGTPQPLCEIILKHCSCFSAAACHSNTTIPYLVHLPSSSTSSYSHSTSAACTCSAWDTAHNGPCAAANYNYRYSYFFGDPKTQQFTSSFYDQTGNDEGPWGWQTRACSDTLPFICKMPPSAFPCNPPPSPAPPPPEPPSPPSPPRMPSCESLRR